MAVSQGDAEDPPAPRRAPIGDGKRPPASRRRCALPLPSAWWWLLPSAALALSWHSIGRRSLREMLFGYLVAFLIIRIAIVVGRFPAGARRHERFRIIPMDTVAARFWCRRLTAFVGWFAFGWVTIGLLSTLGFSLEERQLVAYVLGLGLLAIALEAVWRRPAALPEARGAQTVVTRRFGRRRARNALLTVGIVLLWVLWVVQSDGRASGSFWSLITLPLAIPHDPARGRASPSAARFAAGGRWSAERHCGVHRARYAGSPDHRCGSGARLGLGRRLAHVRGKETAGSPASPTAC